MLESGRTAALNGRCASAPTGYIFAMIRLGIPSRALLVALLLGKSPLTAQDPVNASLSDKDSVTAGRASRAEYLATAGGDLENYLRYLNAMSGGPSYPWSVRPFSPGQLRELFANGRSHPWQARYDLTGPRGRIFEAGVIEPKTTLFFNSSFPYGSNDGPVWVGRGLTYQVQAGFFARFGPVRLVVAPVAFRAENRSFFVFDTLPTCPPACGSPPYVDYPQRFGSSAYTRLDAGSSFLEVDARVLSAGISTANEWWGPSQFYPYILSDNAPGFPHIFFQTRHPAPILIGRVQARVIYGRLEQSAYSPVTGARRYRSQLEPGRVRFASGLLAVFEPRGLDGLEIGLGRFFHFVWPLTGVPPSYFRKPLGVFFRSNTGPTGVDENQLASFFARWVFPRSGLEIYGEYGREDNSYDKRDFVQEPDHARTYMLGFRKAYHTSATHFSAIRGELINFQVPTLVRTGRGETAIYLHSFRRQGHTNRGQLLGADVGVAAAAGSMMGWDRFSPNGRVSIEWERRVRRENGTFYSTGLVDPKSTDVWHALRAERTKFFQSFDITGGLAMVREFNRDFRSDASNFNATLAVQWRVQ